MIGFYDFVESFRYLLNLTYPGWLELFLSLMTICCAFDIVNLTPDEANEQNLIFPNEIFTTRIAADLWPEEVAPPEPWNKKERIAVCLVNENFAIADSFTNLNIRGRFHLIFV